MAGFGCCIGEDIGGGTFGGGGEDIVDQVSKLVEEGNFGKSSFGGGTGGGTFGKDAGETYGGSGCVYVTKILTLSGVTTCTGKTLLKPIAGSRSWYQPAGGTPECETTMTISLSADCGEPCTENNELKLPQDCPPFKMCSYTGEETEKRDSITFKYIIPITICESNPQGAEALKPTATEPCESLTPAKRTIKHLCCPTLDNMLWLLRDNTVQTKVPGALLMYKRLRLIKKNFPKFTLHQMCMMGHVLMGKRRRPVIGGGGKIEGITDDPKGKPSDLKNKDLVGPCPCWEVTLGKEEDPAIWCCPAIPLAAANIRWSAPGKAMKYNRPQVFKCKLAMPSLTMSYKDTEPIMNFMDGLFDNCS